MGLHKGSFKGTQKEYATLIVKLNREAQTPMARAEITGKKSMEDIES